MNYLNNMLTKRLSIISGTVLGLAALYSLLPSASLAISPTHDSSREIKEKEWQGASPVLLSQSRDVELPSTSMPVNDLAETDQSIQDADVEQTSPQDVEGIGGDVDTESTQPPQITPTTETDIPATETETDIPATETDITDVETTEPWVGIWLVRTSTDEQPGLTYIFQPDNVLFIVNPIDRLAQQSEYRVEASDQPESGSMEIRFTQISDPINVAYQISEDTLTLEFNEINDNESSPLIIQLDRQSNQADLPDGIFILNPRRM